MEITIYNNASSNNTVTKSITPIKQVAATFYEESSVIDPIILLDNDSALYKANYCYIPLFNRYYYIKNITVDNGRQMRLTCHVDVLMSFDIRSLTGVVARNENAYNLYFTDSAFKILNYRQVITKAFPNSFSSNSNLLLTVVG
jgi:hypothetical protein